MAVQSLVSMTVQTFTKSYEYHLKVTGVWEEILGNCSFANFILFNCPDLEVRKRWLDFYKKVLKAYSYWLFIPAIFTLSYEKIKNDPDLSNFFNEFEEWRKLEELKENNMLQQTQDDKEASNIISNLLSFIAKIPSMIVGNFKSWATDAIISGSYAITNLFRKHNWQVEPVIEEILQNYRAAGIIIQATILTPNKWYEYRPTYDFDIIVLLTHIKAYAAYAEMLQKDIEAELNNPLKNNLHAYIKVDGEIKFSVPVDSQNRISFCLSKEMINLLTGEYSEIELGGVKK